MTMSRSTVRVEVRDWCLKSLISVWLDFSGFRSIQMSFFHLENRNTFAKFHSLSRD